MGLLLSTSESALVFFSSTWIAYCTNFNNLKTSLQQYTYGALVISNKNKLLRKLEDVGVG